MENKITPSCIQTDANPTPISASGQPIPNPFTYDFILSTWDKFKVGLMTVTVFPVRLLLIIAIIIVSWILACVGLSNLSGDQLSNKPLAGWRWQVNRITRLVVRTLYFVGGFHWVTMKGRQASPKEAPILVLAPHSSYYDVLPIVCLGAPSVIAKIEIHEIPLLGKLVDFIQPLYVKREDRGSRQVTVRMMLERVESKHTWSQVAIFPEGTCTNRTSLISFKPGAFYAGVPVQPVCIRYPSTIDCFTWSWKGPGVWKSVWVSLCQLNNQIEIEFLPVYKPSAYEIEDPKKYACSVRNLMAEVLGLPVSDYSYDDCRFMDITLSRGLPYTWGLVGVLTLQDEFQFPISLIQDCFEAYLEMVDRTRNVITVWGFSKYLGLPAREPCVQDVFRFYDKDRTGHLSFHQYLTGLQHIANSKRSMEFAELLFQGYKNHDKKPLREMTDKVLKNILNLQLQAPSTELPNGKRIKSGKKNSETFIYQNEEWVIPVTPKISDCSLPPSRTASNISDRGVLSSGNISKNKAE